MASRARRRDLQSRLENAASLRAGGTGPPLSDEERKGLEAQAALDEQRSKVDPATKSEILIRQAMDRGDFDNLKYAGKPIPGLDGNHDPDWWLKGLIERENIRDAGPEALLLRRVDEELEATLDRLPSVGRVREAVEEFNARVIAARRQLQGGPPVVTATREVEAEIQRWRERRAAAHAAELEVTTAPVRQGWLARLRRR